MKPDHLAKLVAENKQLRRDRQRLGRYAVENRNLKRQLRAANAQVEGYKQQADAAQRVLEEFKLQHPPKTP